VHGLSGIYEYQRLFPGVETISEETKQLHSESVSRARSGQSLEPQSEETKRLRSKNMKAFWKGLSPKDKAWRLAVSCQQEGASERAGDTLRGVPRPEDVSRRIGESQRQFWAGLSPEERLRRAKNSFLSEDAIMASQEATQKHPNGTEGILWEFLEDSFPGVLVPQWIRRLKIGHRYPDFWTPNGHRLVIESMGDRWHGPEYLDYDDEEVAVQNYEGEGWKCLVVWADNPEDIIVEWPNLKQKIMVDMEV